MSLKNLGILDFNPTNPSFLKLLDAGATVDEFVNATKNSKVKKFAYIIGMVNGQRRDAEEFEASKGSSKTSIPEWKRDLI